MRHDASEAVEALDLLRRNLATNGYRGTIESDSAARVVYGTDNSVYQMQPVGVAVPTSIDDLCAIAGTNADLGRPLDLVARGGGTGTNGQSLTNGLVVDTRRSMNRIVSVDPDAQTAVVQPGVVLGQLNAAVREHGLFFAPHVSTSTRATIGGMVATDAAGKGSLVHGRTNRHVLGIDAVLHDGTPWTFGRIDAASFDGLTDRSDGIGELHRLVRRATTDLVAEVFPDVPRGFTGYDLVGAVRADDVEAGGIDMTKLLCGSEGTLALIGEITVRLSPLASETHLAVLAYRSFDEALRDANRLKAAAPVAIECLDERTISLATASPAWPRFAALLDRVDASSVPSLLLMEFENADGLDRLRDLVTAPDSPTGPDAPSLAITSDPADIAAVWKVRADAVGLLGRSVGGRRSVAFVEDCAVPPERLPDFVTEFRALLDTRGLSYGMFGHADVGCLHVRPALDLYDPDHEAMLRTISDDVAALVARLGGVMWGEHGRGFRGEFVDLPDDVIDRMRLVKTAFDPHDVLNPAKLYRPIGDVAGEGRGQGNDIVAMDAVPLRVHRDRTVAESERAQFESAFACNGNGICHHWGDAEVMCPSYKATLDPRQSPKGRADLLRAWSADPDDEELANDLADSLHTCLSCAACTGRCPLHVDIPELKSRFLERHRERSITRRIRTSLLSRFESALPFAQRSARLIAPLQRLVAPALERVLGLVDLPAVPAGPLPQRLAGLDTPVVSSSADVASAGATVVIVPDAFTAFLDPNVLESTVRVLRRIGERPAVAEFIPSGKLDHVTGRRERFARAVARQRTAIEMFDTTSDDAVPLVVVEPAVSLLSDHEYPAIDPRFPSAATGTLADFLADRVDRITDLVQSADSNRVAAVDRGVVQLFGHCSEVSLDPERTPQYVALLEAIGHTVIVEETSCCGMAGVFGHEVEHREMSKSLFDTAWLPRLTSGNFSARCATGYSCRSQARRFGDVMLLHPIEVVAARTR